ANAEMERVARQALRDTQHGLDNARRALAEAERAAGEIASRRDALEDARQRLMEELEEATSIHAGAEEALRETSDPADLQLRLEQAMARVSADRGALAEAR